MIHIVLNLNQRNKLLSLRQQKLPSLRLSNVDIDPIKITSGEYILPVQLLSDKRYSQFWTLLNTFSQRDVTENELINQPLII